MSYPWFHPEVLSSEHCLPVSSSICSCSESCMRRYTCTDYNRRADFSRLLLVTTVWCLYVDHRRPCLDVSLNDPMIHCEHLGLVDTASYTTLRFRDIPLYVVPASRVPQCSRGHSNQTQVFHLDLTPWHSTQTVCKKPSMLEGRLDLLLLAPRS